MKKLLLFLITLISVMSVNAQIIRADELEKYAKEKYSDKWVDAAVKLSNELSLDKNNAITYVQIIESKGKNKLQLYILLNYWFTSTFNDANSVIKLNDKDSGTIIAQGLVSSVAQHIGGGSSYDVSIKPIIKVDIKDEKVRVTYTVPFYSVIKMIGGGWIGAFGNNQTPPKRSDENWTLDKCFPFANKDSHKKTSSKALIMAHAYSNVVMDKIEEAVKNGMTGTDGDNW